MEVFLFVVYLHFFVVIGFILKKKFPTQINKVTFTYATMYCFLPIMAFWGLTRKSFDTQMLSSMVAYFILAIGFWGAGTLLGKLLFKDKKDISIISISPIISNTGNIGIPLGIFLFGIESAPYISAINIASIFFMQTFGTYAYSRGQFGIFSSILNIFKMPVIWVFFIAILCNISGMTIGPNLDKVLEIGAYSNMGLALFIFGVSIAENTRLRVNIKVVSLGLLLRFIFIPTVTLSVVYFFKEYESAKYLAFAFMMPFAIRNIYMSIIFNCKSETVVALVFFSYILFLPYVFLIKWAIFGFL